MGVMDCQMANHPISHQVYRNILKSFVLGKILPSEDVIAELSKAAGFSKQQLRNDFTTEYRARGHVDDPWESADPLYPE